MIENTSSLKNRFQTLEANKQELVQVAEKASQLTLRYIFPPSNKKDNTYLGKNWQAVGARGVNNLASKLLLTLFPPSGGFFKYSLDESIKAALSPEALQMAENYAMLAEKLTLQELNQLATRHILFESLKHLIITGNIALWLDGNKFKLYDLHNFVVVRDKAMNLVEIILRETVDKDALPANFRELIESNDIPSSFVANKTSDPQNTQYDVFTGAKLINNTWEMWQEINGVEVPGTRKKVKRLPILVLRWTNNEYGHGLIEQVLGDLYTLEQLSKAVAQGSMAAARTLFLVRPSAETSIEALVNAPNGAVVEGNIDDVGTLQLDKFADFRTAAEKAAEIEERLNYMFLVFQPRTAERVTAEEIRRLTEELEALLGGVYTLLAEELQKPLIELIFEKLQKEGKLEKAGDDVKVIITAGFEELSRAATFNKLLTFLNSIGAIPNAVETVNWSEFIMRLVNSLNIDAKGLVLTPEELEAKREEALRMQTQAAAAQAGVQAAVTNSKSNS